MNKTFYVGIGILIAGLGLTIWGTIATWNMTEVNPRGTAILMTCGVVNFIGVVVAVMGWAKIRGR